MRDFARRSEKERGELFRAAAQAMRVHEAIIEKDFWVCWTLDHLFHDSPWREQIEFKGGTSLSKAYAAIERFSEDIDLVLDWRLLGYTEEEPWAERSATQQDKWNKAADQRAVEFLQDKFSPVLRNDLTEHVAAPIVVAVIGLKVMVHYPRAFSLSAILPQICLEIGPLAAWTPNEETKISPYAAVLFPKLFSQPVTTVRTVAAERTFWEKATILHQEAHRAPENPRLPRHSRHYYDLYRLSQLPVRQAALAKLDLLGEVVQFKKRFYRCPWAMYDNAKPGSLRLLPPEHGIDGLRRDYRSMRDTLFGTVPEFDEIIAGLAELEKAINSPGGAH